MQKRHESILNSINNSKISVLTAPVHERYQSNWATLPYTFYMMQDPTFNKWNREYAEIPENHMLLNGTERQIKEYMFFDLILSQNKFGNFQRFKPISENTCVPMISLEHTLPMATWTDRYIDETAKMRGCVNVFISEYSAKKWHFDLDDPTVEVIHHGIDTDTFKPADHDRNNDGKILTVVNDWINRDHFCNFGMYKRICLDNNMPVNPVGKTEGFSEPVSNKAELVNMYQHASVFFNTSVISPIPTALLEAMAVGTPVVSTATCMIPEIIEDGVNGFISNDEKYLKDRLEWCLRNPEDAAQLGERGRETILNHFNLKNHLSNWDSLFKRVYGTSFLKG